MSDLLNIRDSIDSVDNQILKLFEHRMELCKQVAEYKIKNNLGVYDKKREEEKIDSLSKLASNEFNKQGISELFSQIMSSSRKLQYEILNRDNIYREVAGYVCQDNEDSTIPTVVFQGIDGAYSQEAMEDYFRGDIKSFNVDSFEDILIALEDGSAQYGVLPIENSSTGTVDDIYELLVKYNCSIIGEQIIKVEHALLALPEARIEDIKTVYSHPQGLLQCRKFLEQYDWQKISLLNTAVSARKVFGEQDITKAAIASKRAASCYGLNILREKLNHNSMNYTRFIILSLNKTYTQKANKISVCFELPHTSGSLYKMLSNFMYNNLNLVKIESRPIENSSWQYRFFVDFKGNLSEPGVINAIKSIQEEASNFKLLGNYYSELI